MPHVTEYSLEKILAKFTGNAQKKNRTVQQVLEDLATWIAANTLAKASELAAAASTTVAGLVELATSAETKTGTDTARAVTPKGLADALALVKFYTFAGVAAAGPVTVTGVKVGDVITSVINVTDTADASASFETAVTVNDQVQQSSASDLSTKKFQAVILRMH